MGYFGDSISHPNEKRSKISQLLNTMGKNYDGRIICDDYADTNATQNKALIIPLPDFCDHIAGFEYNINVSGYRMSIPNRFMESFIVGTAIMTDKLAVKWYLPFDEEVVETVEMGYLPNKDVDWRQFEQDLKSLPKADKSRIIELFEQKWRPDRVANYIITTVLQKQN